jgi:uncharacterized protein
MRKTATALLLVLTLVLTGCVPMGGGGASTGPVAGLRSRDLTIDLGDGFMAKAQLTYPAEGAGPWPVVILFHGSGPVDMDATFTSRPGAKPESANFRLLAEKLGAEGVAVLRFHKRGVNAYGKYDQAQMLKATTNQLITDAGKVIAAAAGQPEVDGKRIYLYGWSQGAQVAAHAAATHPGVAGLILQGPPVSGWTEMLTYQHLTLGIPFLKEQGDKNGDGKLSTQEWMGLPYGAPALMGSFYVWAPDSTLWKPKLRADLDRNSDGLTDIEGELRPLAEALVANPAASGSPFMHPANEPAESVAQVVARGKQPVLVLHGELDGWVPVAEGEKVAAAAPDRVTLKRYAGLGHALSPTEKAWADGFGVMDGAPIADMVAWLKAR